MWGMSGLNNKRWWGVGGWERSGFGHEMVTPAADRGIPVGGQPLTVRYLGSLIPGTENPPVEAMGCHTSLGFFGGHLMIPLTRSSFPSPSLLPPTPPPSTNPPSLLHSVKDMPCSEDVTCHTPTLAGGGGDNDTVFSSSPTTTDGMWAFLCVSMSMIVYNYTMYMRMDVLCM